MYANQPMQIIDTLAPPVMAAHQRISVAPMMDWTTKDYRYFARLLNPRAWLYTEMITTGALLHGDAAHFLAHYSSEAPLVLQLGGSNPSELAACAKMAEDAGYNEVNLNVGCPSDRVQHNKIGACLMAEPQLVADCVHAMQAACKLPITVKHRIGIDDLDSFEHMQAFVQTVASTGCTRFIVHARIALLAGLSPKENREIPPLRYADVYKLKALYPHLTIEINGGIADVAQTQAHLAHTDGVMIGRAAYHNPYILAELNALHGAAIPTRRQVLEGFMPYVEQRLAEGLKLHMLTRHILGLYHGQVGARYWRQQLSGHKLQTLADFSALVGQMDGMA